MEIEVNISVPDELLNSDGQQVSRRVFEQFVIEGYKKGKLTTKNVRELLGFSSRFETEDFLHRNRAFDYTVDDLKNDLQTTKDLGLK